MKRLYMDIEVSPTKGYVYEKYETNVLGVEERSIMFSIAWKWEHENKVNCVTIADFPLFKKDAHNDLEVVKKAWELLDEANIVIAHNGNGFDLKKLNTFFVLHGLTPPSPFKSVDTLLVARRYFKFFGNALNDLASFFNIEGKIETSKGLWKRCLDGDIKAYREMKRYNKQDVVVLERIYKILLPWVSNHPHVDPEMGTSACPNCGSTDIRSKGEERLVMGVKPCFKCHDCGRRFYGKLKKLD